MATVTGAPGARSRGVPPVRPGHVLPPVAEVAQVDGSAGLAKDQRAGVQKGGVGVWVLRRVERAFGDRHIARLGHEAPDLADRHRVAVDPESVYRHAVDGLFLGIEAL